MSHTDGRRPADEAGLQGQTETDAAIVPAGGAERKALATLQAEAALQGIELLQLVDGRLLASRDGHWFRLLRTEHDLARCLGQEWLA